MLEDCDIAHIIKYLVLGMNKTAFNTAMKNEDLACQLTETVFKRIDAECQDLCKKENSSILRHISPTDLVELKLQSLKAELCLKAPMLTKLLSNICKSKRSKSNSQVRVDEVVVPTVASVILHS